MPLAGAEGLIGQLVLLLIIAVIGWITKRSAEAEQRKRSQAPPTDADVEVSLPPPVPFPQPTPRPTPGPAPRPAPGPAPVPVPPSVPPPGPAIGTARLVPRRARVIRPHLPHTSIAPAMRVASASQVDAGRRRRAAFARLGGGSPIPPNRELTRSGILWSEVLGPPRAHLGPHENPVLRRRRR